MAEIVIGTTNVAKARQCELALASTGVATTRLTDLLEVVPPIAEAVPTGDRALSRDEPRSRSLTRIAGFSRPAA
jgi:hypothetical protein